MKGRAGKRRNTVQGKTRVLCYRNRNCDRTLVFEDSRQNKIRHTHTHTHTPGRTSVTSYQSVALAATYTTHNKHNRRTYMPSAGFEPAIPEIKQPQTDTSDHTATGFGRSARIPSDNQ